jgi:hypothetical protein
MFPDTLDYPEDHIYDDITDNITSQQSLDIIENTLSQAAFDRAATWLARCLEEDRDCDNPNSSFMPRCLLNVGSRERPSDPYLFEPVEPLPYVCLSYCWGTDLQSIVTTTKANLRSHHEAIPYASLSLTIRDAITVCRGLGIPNLWVDALCIIQDDRSSWLQESAEMGSIYGNSRLTIAALEPASCKLGFLGKQLYGSREWQRRFTPIVDGKPTASLFIRQNTTGSDEKAPTGFTLDKRGWCLQESLLPNRRLCFNGYEMTWECQHRTTCECGHSMNGLPDTTSIGRLGSNIKSVTSTSNLVLSRFHNQKDPAKPYEDVGALLLEFLSPVSEWFQNPDKPTQRHEVWRALVEEYSKRSLTQPTDKLNAVSGLAKNFMAQYTSAIYLAGLWRVELLFYLTWIVSRSESGAHKHSLKGPQPPYRAPSWSWASTDEPVQFGFWKSVRYWEFSTQKKDNCTIKKVVCQNLLADDTTGPVTAAHMVLTGPLVPVELAVLNCAFVSDDRTGHKTIVRGPNVCTALVRAKNLRGTEVFLDAVLEPSFPDGDPNLGCWEQRECIDKCCIWKDQQDQVPQPHLEINKNPVYCFRLFTWRSTEDHIRMEIWFLVLRKSSNVEDVYERIGIGKWTNTYNDEWDPVECPLFEESKKATVKII